MNKNQIAKKYSRALISTYDIAEVPGVIKGLHIFLKLTEINKEVKLLFASRIFSDDEKDKALKTILSHLKAPRQTEKFLRLIIMRRHLLAIKEIINASTAAYNERLKKMKAMVISSVTLEQSYIDRLRNILKTQTQCEIDIENQIDPSLLGGFIVKVGSTVYDSSLKGQFRLLKDELTR